MLLPGLDGRPVQTGKFVRSAARKKRNLHVTTVGTEALGLRFVQQAGHAKNAGETASSLGGFSNNVAYDHVPTCV